MMIIARWQSTFPRLDRACLSCDSGPGTLRSAERAPPLRQGSGASFTRATSWVGLTYRNAITSNTSIVDV
jgi:hypothetical protein